MKTLIVILALSLVGCTTKTEHGSCIGLNGKEDPTLNYNYSGWNIGMAILFSEMIVPPVIVVLDQLKCPTSKK